MITGFTLAAPRELVRGCRNDEFLEAVRRFQAALDLEPDGILGPNTARRIRRVHEGEAAPLISVADAQEILKEHGDYRGEVTGKYNRHFEAVLRHFQGQNCLVLDGRLRKQTAKELEAGKSS